MKTKVVFIVPLLLMAGCVSSAGEKILKPSFTIPDDLVAVEKPVLPSDYLMWRRTFRACEVRERQTIFGKRDLSGKAFSLISWTDGIRSDQISF